MCFTRTGRRTPLHHRAPGPLVGGTDFHTPVFTSQATDGSNTQCPQPVVNSVLEHQLRAALWILRVESDVGPATVTVTQNKNKRMGLPRLSLVCFATLAATRAGSKTCKMTCTN